MSKFLFVMCYISYVNKETEVYVENVTELDDLNRKYDEWKGSLEIYLIDLNAVSYTHLDVYKRQEDATHVTFHIENIMVINFT